MSKHCRDVDSPAQYYNLPAVQYPTDDREQQNVHSIASQHRDIRSMSSSKDVLLISDD